MPDEPGAALYRRIGGAIKATRQARGLTQAQIADAVGVLRTSVANIEAGRQRLPIDLLYDIADALRCDPRELLPPTEEV